MTEEKGRKQCDRKNMFQGKDGYYSNCPLTKARMVTIATIL